VLDFRLKKSNIYIFHSTKKTLPIVFVIYGIPPCWTHNMVSEKRKREREREHAKWSRYNTDKKET